VGSQREKLVYYVQTKGSLRNCLAIYGISRDMTKTQEDICVSLELLISELSEEPCKGKIVNNTDYPTLCKIEGRNLQSNFEFMRQLNYSRNVNIQMVFDQYWDFLFQKIQAKRRCRKRYFGDFGFQQASANYWGMWGSYKRKKGYTELPEIVFWNLRGDLSFPARHSNGVTMVNGYSNDSLAALLERDVVPLLEHLVRLVHPDHVVKSAVSGELCENLLVYN